VIKSRTYGNALRKVRKKEYANVYF